MKIKDFNNYYFSRFSQSPNVPIQAATDPYFPNKYPGAPTQQSYKILNTRINM